MKVGTKSLLFGAEEFAEEEWKECSDFPNYFVSNFGRVKSIDRMVGGVGNSLRRIKGKIHINFTSDPNGYYCVSCNSITVFVHRLVAKAFIPNPLNLPQVNHKDGIKTNCKSINLEWCTSKHNTEHAYNTGLNPTGEKHLTAKLSNTEVIEILNKYKIGTYTQKQLAKEYNVCESNIWSIINNRTRKRG